MRGATGKHAPLGGRTAEDIYRAYLHRHDLVTGGYIPPYWTSDGMGLCVVTGAPEDTTVQRVDLRTGDAVSTVDVTAVRAALAAATGHEPPYRGLPMDSFTCTEDGAVEFDYSGTTWRLDPATGSVTPRTASFDIYGKFGWREPRPLAPRIWKRCLYSVDRVNVLEHPSPDGEWFASVQGNNILLRSAEDGRERALTANGTPDRFWDIEVPFPFDGLGWLPNSSDAGGPWSPDSLTLLAYLRDVTGVFRMPRIHWSERFEEVDYVPLQKAGAKLDRIEPVFVDVRSGRQVSVSLSEIEDRYIQWLAWCSGGGEALLIVYSRDMKHVEIIASNCETGAVRTLMSENAPTAVKIQINEVFCREHGFRLLPNGSGFLWRSTRDGWNHLYHYDMNGQLIGQLTRGDWPVYAVVHISADGFIYFTAAIDAKRPYDVHVCRVLLGGGEVEQLTHEKGMHSPRFAPRGQAFLDTHSTVDRPMRTDLVKADGTKIRVLAEMDISSLKAMGYTPAEEFTVKAADGETDLWGVMYKPFDFSASRSYPVIESIYGGPQIAYAPRSFAIHKWRYLNLLWALAQLGYITICVDARGTPGRSKAFQDVVHGNWAAGLQDHAAAIRQLCARYSWMDASRVGIYGHSWGGYFSTCALIQAPDVYHAAVSYEPGYDPWQSVGYEPYLGLPQRERAAYERAELVKQACNVRGRLMIVSGTAYNLTAPTAMRMTRALIDCGIDHEFVVVPDASHSFVGAEEDYLFMKLTGWFDRHVKHRVPG